jgi:hypothetical protein
MEQTLIQLQEQAIEAILSARVQTKASCMYGMTILNRSRRMVGAIRRQYVKGLAKWDIPPTQYYQLWKDVCDMAELEAGAE